jgi:hypothetical protein
MVQFASASAHGKEVVADPTPMGLLGLAVGFLTAQGLVDLSGEDEACLSPAGIDRWESHLVG